MKISFLDQLRRDHAHAFRMLARKPRFVGMVILMLALGIGANTAVFSVFDAVVLRPLPFKDSRRLIGIWESEPKKLDSTGIWNSWRDLVSWRRASRNIEELAAYSWIDADPVLRGNGAPRRVFAVPATANFFSLLGVRAALGRTFEPQDKMGDALVVLSYSFWKTQLGGNPNAVGSTLDLDRKAYTIIGVMPAGFEFYPREIAMWHLMSHDAAFVKDPNNHSVVIFGRMRPGVRLERAQNELRSIRANVNKSAPDGVPEFIPVLHSLQADFTWLTGRNLSRTLLLLLGAVACLLMIACLNVANLLFTRGAERRKEIAIRSALGSGRGRLLQQLLTEALVLSVIGAAAGVVLAAGAVHYFQTVNPVQLPPGNPVTVDFRVLSFSAALGILTTLLCGLTPAWRASRVDLNEALKDAGRGWTAGASRPRTARFLVVLEVSLSLVLLVGAGLMIQSVNRMAHTSLGYRPDHLLSLEVNLPDDSYSKREQVAHFFDRLLERIARLRTVEGAVLSSSLPLYSSGNEVVAVQGHPAPPPDVTFGDCGQQTVSPGFFRLLGIPLYRGRDFELQDRAGAESVAIVNRAFADRYFPRVDAVGRHIRIGTPLEKQPWLTIVGVAGVTKGVTAFREMAWITSPVVYRPYSQNRGNSSIVLVRFTGDAEGLAAAVPRQVTALDPNLPVNSGKMVGALITENLKYPAFRANILSAFAALALLLAALGLFGVISQMVVSRTREIGIRMALGATRVDVIGLIARQGILMTLSGAAIGLVEAALLTRTVTSLLYEIQPADPLTFFWVTTVLCAAAVIAVYIPARRAANLDPTVALKWE
ncbi:MAG TPA: ABC transporter permease [Bryobacteraceae bacterium]|nr:ABC transporter permease [Bryobacteraceae bacterium]